jgi:competence protein ComEA
VLISAVVILYVALFKPFSHNPAPPIAGTLETIQNPIASPIPTEEQVETNPAETEINESVVVDVKGQVHTPGVYTLPAGSRVLDALQLAGGILPTAEEKALNFAAKLVDEMVIYVPLIGETEVPLPVAASPSTSESQSALVNINTADETTLKSLSGIGPSKAKAIITYREEKGLFTSIEDIKDVTGIGDSTFENLKEFISVN